ncbi:DUF2061 domain-containing protein [Enhydrobacter aerosaccus]|nr:DUF2061 domain-containing protein [Enhydrobacter aerosaccus]
MTIGLSVLAGAAALEAALIPGIVIGAAAVILPEYLPNLGRRRPRRVTPALRQRESSHAFLPVLREGSALPTLRGFGLKRAVAKTITFRAIVTSLDFTVNYVVIGEIATAAGLSAASLAVGPLFYLAHETVWNRHGRSEISIELPFFATRRQGEVSMPRDRRQLRISRVVAKTITFRTIASTVDFTVNYIVVGDLATAFALSAFGLVAGPFIYVGHELAWDHFSPGEQDKIEPPRDRVEGGQFSL